MPALIPLSNVLAGKVCTQIFSQVVWKFLLIQSMQEGKEEKEKRDVSVLRDIKRGFIWDRITSSTNKERSRGHETHHGQISCCHPFCFWGGDSQEWRERCMHRKDVCWSVMGIFLLYGKMQESGERRILLCIHEGWIGVCEEKQKGTNNLCNGMGAWKIQNIWERTIFGMWVEWKGNCRR